MKRLILLIALLAPCVTWADESCANVASTAGGTSVLAADTSGRRNSLLVQNIGATNAVTCSIGGTPVAVQHGFYLSAAGGNLNLPLPPINPGTPGTANVSVPAGAVKCITASSTSYVCAVAY